MKGKLDTGQKFLNLIHKPSFPFEILFIASSNPTGNPLNYFAASVDVHTRHVAWFAGGGLPGTTVRWRSDVGLNRRGSDESFSNLFAIIRT